MSWDEGIAPWVWVLIVVGLLFLVGLLLALCDEYARHLRHKSRKTKVKSKGEETIKPLKGMALIQDQFDAQARATRASDMGQSPPILGSPDLHRKEDTAVIVGHPYFSGGRQPLIDPKIAANWNTRIKERFPEEFYTILMVPPERIASSSGSRVRYGGGYSHHCDDDYGGGGGYGSD